MQNNTNQPQVRSGSLPTNVPNVQPRTATRRVVEPSDQDASFDDAGGQDNAASPEGGKKPRKQRKPKMRLEGELSPAEYSILGRITMKASQQGVTPAKYIDNLKKAMCNDELEVWAKVTKNAPAPLDEAPLED